MRSIKFYSLIFFLAFALSIVFALPAVAKVSDNKSSSGSSVVITIQKNNRVNTEKIALGQIAQIQADLLLKESLEKLIVGNAPKPEKIKVYNKDKIISLIQGCRYLPKDTIIMSADRVYVKRLSQKISKEDVRQFVIDSFHRRYPEKEFELTRFQVQGLDLYPQGKTIFKADTRDMLDTRGRVSVFIDVMVDGTRVDRISVKGEVAVYEKIFLASGNFKKDQKLSRADLHLERKNVFELEQDYVRQFKTIENKVLKINLKKGDCLRTSQFSEPFLVKKGEVVTLVAKNENLMIVTSGICKENGFKNSPVQVENLSSGKLIRGIVREKSKVEVVY